jgi:predicted GIY-YIG superfamily endonuclease
MELYLLIALLLSLIFIFILYKQLKHKQKILEKTVFEKHDLEILKKEEIKDYFKEEWEQEKQKIDYEYCIYKNDISSQRVELANQYKIDATKINGEIQKLDAQLKEKQFRYNEVNQDLDLYREGKIKEIDSAAAEYEQRKRLLVDASIVQYREVRGNLYNQELKEMETQKNSMTQELSELKSELEEEQNKRAAINEEILRQKKLEEQQDFFRIQLNPDDSNDIELLRSITPRLRHPEAINKVIWTGYYQKPLAELRKRILTNGDVSGVYKITRLKTNEIYIGQTTSVDKRWQEHVKSALGVGTLASSQLHRVMAADGCENFTFELLEEVPKDKLRERESYYIDFYDSKTYGLNSVTGDKNK